MVLFLHNRYRVMGGEERAVEDLMWLVREQLDEEAELLSHDSAVLGRARAAVALLRGGLDPGDVVAAVRLTRARVVSAHNVNPAFGWRALAAARGAGARVASSGPSSTTSTSTPALRACAITEASATSR